VEHLVELHGGTFLLKSELRKGTEAIVELPPHRVLQTMEPLQPLGQETHRLKEPAPRPLRPPRLRKIVKTSPAQRHSTSLN
jgi:two-component system cell cycle sensor histidine kinase PleC